MDLSALLVIRLDKEGIHQIDNLNLKHFWNLFTLVCGSTHSGSE